MIKTSFAWWRHWSSTNQWILDNCKYWFCFFEKREIQHAYIHVRFNAQCGTYGVRMNVVMDRNDVNLRIQNGQRGQKGVKLCGMRSKFPISCKLWLRRVSAAVARTPRAFVWTVRRSFLPVSCKLPGSRPCHAFAGIDLVLPRIPWLPHATLCTLWPPPRAMNCVCP